MEEGLDVTPVEFYERQSESLVNTRTLYLMMQGHIRSYVGGIQM